MGPWNCGLEPQCPHEGGECLDTPHEALSLERQDQTAHLSTHQSYQLKTQFTSFVGKKSYQLPDQVPQWWPPRSLILDTTLSF